MKVPNFNRMLLGPDGVGFRFLVAAALAVAGVIFESRKVFAMPSPERVTLERGRVVSMVTANGFQLRYYVYVPKSGGAGRPVLVAVHGISRNARELASMFVPVAEKSGSVLVAPLFTEDRFDDYQRLGRLGRGKRADRALLALVEELGALEEARTEALYLFGHSGGAQFVHRFAMAYPESVSKYAISAAGWYTMPYESHDYPVGIRGAVGLPGVTFEPARFLRVPACVIVGDKDRRRTSSLKQNPTIDALQGRHRRSRAESWILAMTAAARSRGLRTRYDLEILPNVAHGFGALVSRGHLVERVSGCLFAQRT